jgi:hypothetical protein
MHGAYYRNFEHVFDESKNLLRTKGKLVDVGRWQGIDVKDNPQMVTHELFDWHFTCQIPASLEELVSQTKPNLPWADEHFEERVGGIPSNPGEAYKNWPFFKRQKSNDRHRDDEGKHSHTYQERIWTPPLEGIRYEYGNLGDVIDLLEREPLTRQAFLPLWFPEDTGVKHKGRVPCTLGYHFMVRNGELHIFYPIRACDYFRHFRDDVYMASRMALWILGELKEREIFKNRYMKGEEFKGQHITGDDHFWDNIKIGKLRMHIYSLHVFAGEVHLLNK